MLFIPLGDYFDSNRTLYIKMDISTVDHSIEDKNTVLPPFTSFNSFNPTYVQLSQFLFCNI